MWVNTYPFLQMILFVSLFGFAFHLIYSDIKEQRLHLVSLLGFIAISVIKHAFFQEVEGFLSASTIFLILLSLKGLWLMVSRQNLMGNGDLGVAFGCGLWLHLPDLALYFVTIGIIALGFGITWTLLFHLRTYPFAPALLLGLGIVLLIRCFATNNGL